MSSEKLLEDNSQAHIVPLLYKLTTSARRSDDLSIGFNRDRGRTQRKLTNNKNMKLNHQGRNLLRDIFGFAEHQEKATLSIEYKIVLTRISDHSVLNKVSAKLKLLLFNGVYRIIIINSPTSHFI